MTRTSQPDPPPFWWASQPPPPAIPKSELEAAIRSAFPEGEAASGLISLLKPSVRLWPQVPDLRTPRRPHSRLGGKPLAPKGWEWPLYDAEPMLFIGQIDCAEISGFAAAAPLPRDGLLAFFADPDVASGCGGWGNSEEGAVFHWPAGSTLVETDPPEPDVEIVPECSLVPFEVWELPDSFSARMTLQTDDKDFRHRYFEIAGEHGIRVPEAPRGLSGGDIISLLGWSYLVQRELETVDGAADDENWRLLLQVGTYDNGSTRHYWGPGGMLYFVIEEKDLAAGDFSRVVFEAQHT